MTRIFFCLSILYLLEGQSSAVPSAPLPVGTPAPTVTASDQGSRPVHLADIYSKGVTLVFFFPIESDFASKYDAASLAEVISLRDAYDKLHAEGLQIVGVSLDDAIAQKKFKQDNKLPYMLIADIHGKAGTAFGVGIYGGGDTPHRYDRVSFLVKDNKIAWNSLKAQTNGSATEVQKALDSLK